MEEEITQLQNRLNELTLTVNNHTHVGYDRSKKLKTTIFTGSVAANGTAVKLPTGWTSAKTGTGTYTVTHNLGISNFVLTATATGAAVGTPVVYSKSISTFVIFIDNVSTLTDTPFDFILSIL